MRRRPLWGPVVGFGLVSLATDMVSDGARPLGGPLLAQLGASALFVGLVTGAAEAASQGLRLVFGPWADRTGKYWTFTMAGYALTVVCVPLLALTPLAGYRRTGPGGRAHYRGQGWQSRPQPGEDRPARCGGRAGRPGPRLRRPQVPRSGRGAPGPAARLGGAGCHRLAAGSVRGARHSGGDGADDSGLVASPDPGSRRGHGAADAGPAGSPAAGAQFRPAGRPPGGRRRCSPASSSCSPWPHSFGAPAWWPSASSPIT